jgi:hypothetical protein
LHKRPVLWRHNLTLPISCQSNRVLEKKIYRHKMSNKTRDSSRPVLQITSTTAAKSVVIVRFIDPQQRREMERKNNMIHINLLSETDRGRWVIYSAISLHSERGRIKDWTDQLVYVVYQCDDQWDRFEEYTAAATDPADLDFV